MQNMLEKLFQLKANNTTVRTEVIAGITTFLAMAYILFVNPDILSAAGMDKGQVFTATCLAAALGTLIMGLYANLPIALAPGMGLNAFFAFGIVLGMGHTWQTALGAVFISGVVFMLLSIFKVREWIINAIPSSLRLGIAAGIGAFLAFIALKNAGVVVANPATFVGLGEITSAPVLMAILGFFLIVALEYRRIPGGVMISILVVTALALLFGLQDFYGLTSTPPAPAFMEMDLKAAFELSMLSVIFSLLFVDLFDTAGTLLAVANKANLTTEDGKVKNLGKALLADSTATTAGAIVGTSSTTSYVESVAGVAAGGRTGLTAVVVAILFMLSLFLSPLALTVPAFATAPALLYVGVLMMSTLRHVEWDDLTEAAPVVVTVLMMLLSFSIANGIALGFITYAVGKLIAGRMKDVNIAVAVLAILFICKYIFLPTA